MGSLFDEAAVIEHADAMSFLNGAETVRNHKTGAVRAELLERLLHQAFRAVIEGRGGFIEQQKRWVFEQGAGD